MLVRPGFEPATSRICDFSRINCDFFLKDKEDGVYTRDFAKPTLEDHFDKTVIPKVMQVSVHLGNHLLSTPKAC